MNCEQIKDKVGIREVLESFSLFPVKDNQRAAFYFALDRKESTPSLSVDFIKNKAFDFGTGKSYDVVSIVQQMNQCSVSEALFYLQKFSFSFQKKNEFDARQEKDYQIIKVQDIQHLALIQYLKSRKVFEQRDLVKEIHYILNGNKFFGIGFYNNAGGLEIRNKYSKICLGKKDVTLIKRIDYKCEEVCVFEGFFDLLTYCHLQKDETENVDLLVLNSTAMFFKVEKQLLNYDKINIFLDNDLNGKSLSNKILNGYDNVEDCSYLYNDSKDFNEWFIRSKDF